MVDSERVSKLVDVDQIVASVTTDEGVFLDALSDGDFVRVVSADVKQAVSRAVFEELRQPENADRWHEALVQLRRDVDTKMAQKEADLAEERVRCHGLKDGQEIWLRAKADYQRWRAKTVYFRAAVEGRMTEVKRPEKETKGSSGDGRLRLLVERMVDESFTYDDAPDEIVVPRELMENVLVALGRNTGERDGGDNGSTDPRFIRGAA
jgi:hypothetical protein